MESKFIINPSTNMIQYYYTDNISDYLEAKDKHFSEFKDSHFDSFPKKLCVKSNGRLTMTEDDIIGFIHREDGPAICYEDGDEVYFLYGKGFNSKEEWFEALTSEQKYKAMWNINGS